MKTLNKPYAKFEAVVTHYFKTDNGAEAKTGNSVVTLWDLEYMVLAGVYTVTEFSGLRTYTTQQTDDGIYTITVLLNKPVN
jgi:hypothetical protein